MTPEEDGFTEYRRLILGELQRLNTSILTIEQKIDTLRDKELSDLRIDVAMLKAKASIMGGAAGALVALLMKLFVK